MHIIVAYYFMVPIIYGVLLGFTGVAKDVLVFLLDFSTIVNLFLSERDPVCRCDSRSNCVWRAHARGYRGCQKARARQA